jgi:hypothetical protein
MVAAIRAIQSLSYNQPQSYFWLRWMTGSLLSRLGVGGFTFLGRKKDDAAVNRHAVELNVISIAFGLFEGAAETMPIGLLVVFTWNDAVGDEVGACS